MKYLFLDTNILLHYQSFEDIPWKMLLQIQDDVTIVICETVVAEVDKHKDGVRSRLRDRAKKMSARLSELLLDDAIGKQPVLFRPLVKPTKEEEGQYELSICDNRIILAALHSEFSHEDIIVISADNNLLIKAKAAGLGFHKMKDEYQLKAELTEEEKELKRVKDELARWTNRKSSPEVVFVETNDNYLTFERVNYKPIDELLAERVANEAARYPEEKIEEINYENCFDVFQSQLAAYSKAIKMHDSSQKVVFNQMREEYLDAFRKKESLSIQKQMRDYSFKKLELGVFNGGTAQTGDLFVVLKFPEDVKIYTPKVSMQKYAYEPPVKPQYDRNLANLQSLNLCRPFDSLPDNTVNMWNPEKPIDKFEFTINLSRLTHGLLMKIDRELYINTEELQDFEIEWSIADSSLLDHCRGKLRVVVADKEKGTECEE